jgi:hypothetical protein
MVLTLRIIHIFAAAILVGSVIFNYYFLRPALTLIPPAHAVVVAQRVGTVFTYLGWVALAFLVFSGVLRLHYNEDLAQIFTLELYTTSYGRALGMMIFFWFLTVGYNSSSYSPPPWHSSRALQPSTVDSFEPPDASDQTIDEACLMLSLLSAEIRQLKNPRYPRSQGLYSEGARNDSGGVGRGKDPERGSVFLEVVQ